MILIVMLMYLLLGGVLFMLMRLYTRGNVANLFREPISLALLGLLIIHAFLPLVQYPSHYYRYQQEGYSLFAHASSIGVVLLFTVVLVGTYSMFGTTSYQRELPVLIPMSQVGKVYLLLGVILPAVIAVALYYRTIMSFGFERWSRDRIWYSDRIGLSSLICRWLYVSFLVSVAAYFVSPRRSKRMLLLFIILGVFVVIFFGLIQSRNAIFFALVGGIGVYWATSPSSKGVLKGLLLSKTAMIIYVALVVMIVVYRLRPMAKDAERDSVPLIVLKVLNGGFGNHENVLWMMDNEFDIQYGATYAAGLVNVVPRAYWPSKPMGAGPYMRNLVRPGSYVAGARGLSSLTTGMVTESYMNGGLVGVVVIAVITGAVLRLLARLRSKCHGPWSVTIYCHSTLILAFAMTYGEFLGIYTRWITDIFPLVIGFIISEAQSWLSRGRQNRPVMGR